MQQTTLMVVYVGFILFVNVWKEERINLKQNTLRRNNFFCFFV